MAEYIREQLKNGLRSDWRTFSENRPIEIQLGNSHGQAHVKLGKTSVFASITSEVVRPSASNPTEGLIRFITEFSPMAFPNVHRNVVKDKELILSKTLEMAIKKSQAVDSEGLCILAGKQVWAINVRISVLNYEGNALDCCCIAAMTALLHFKRPDVSVDGNHITIFDEGQKQLIPLHVHHIPIATTFSIYDGGKLQLTDPNLQEETFSDGFITIIVNEHREICSVLMAGGEPVDHELVVLLSKIAAEKAADVVLLIKRSANSKAATR